MKTKSKGLKVKSQREAGRRIKVVKTIYTLA
jgi:hypothetical protein